MNLFRKSLAALLGCALFATTALVADAGLVSQVAVLTFAGAAGVVVTAEESPRVLQAEAIPDRVFQEAEAEVFHERVLQQEPTSAPTTGSPTGALTSDSPTDAPTSGGAAMFGGVGASMAAMSCALAALAGGAMAAV